MDPNQQNTNVNQPTVINTSQIPQSPPVQPAAATSDIKYAGFWVRMSALIIDIFIITVVLLLILFPLAKLGALGEEAKTGPVNISIGGSKGTAVNDKAGGMSSLVVDITLALVVLVYGVGTVSAMGATLGKKAMGIKVIDKEGNNPNVLKAFLRSLSKFILAPLLFGFLVAAFSEKKQALHDMIAGTYVIAYSSRGKAITLAILATLAILIGILIFKFAVLLALLLGFLSQFKPH